MTEIQLNLVVVRSHDINKSVLFYQRLGLNFVKHRHGSGLEHFASEGSLVTFEIYPCTSEASVTIATRLGFQVDSVDEIVQELEKSGAAIISSPKDSPWGRRAIIVDPDGHKIELTQGTYNLEQIYEVKDMKIAGTWLITEMSNWDEDYYNMEVPAYFELDESGSGDFQFGLVSGQIDGEIIKNKSGEKVEFTWDGNDEMDDAAGSGWLKLKDRNTLEGKIKFHQGDSSLFLARRA